MKRIAIVLLLLLTPDCAVHSAVHFRYSEQGVQTFKQLPISWNFSCDFPVELRPSAREGFEYWNKTLDRKVFTEVEECGVGALIAAGVPRVFVLFVPGQEPTRPDVLATTDVGLFDGVPRSAIMRYYGTWAAAERTSSRWSVSRHEVGHVLGFAHSDFDSCLMYPKIDMSKYSRKPKQACKEEVSATRSIYGKKE